jgi:hypothetical protein
MAYTTADGPPDVDASHAWAPFSGTGVTMNAPMTLTGTQPTPGASRIMIEQITGWRSLPESDDNRAERTYGEGEIVFPGLLKGKTLVYEGQVRALDWTGLKGPANSMVLGFSNMSDEGVMTVTPHSFIGGPVWTYSARVLSLEFDPKPEVLLGAPEPFRWAFQLNLRMSDPRFYTGGSGYL